MELIDDTKVRAALSEADADAPYDDSHADIAEGESGSEADSEDSEEPRLPRAVIVAFREPHGVSLRVKKDQMRFTRATNPIMADKLEFMLAGDIIAPQYLPMLSRDWNLTPAALTSAMFDSEVPMSEHIRKEVFY
jgi:hypothetical protein